MHPAISVIFFTTATGAGYGLLFLSVLTAIAGRAPPGPVFPVASLAIALSLITGGLLASTFHLGHPERAWRALTQWRSSWLSREGVLALATYLPTSLFAYGWIIAGRVDGVFQWAGLAVLVLSVATVACTGMIYQSLKPIPRWHNAFVTPVYLAFALSTGALWLALFAGGGWAGWIAAAATAAAWALKLAYWRRTDSIEGPSLESATGLTGLGKVRPFEAPHTSASYLTKEMGYAVARRHAAKLRRIALWGGGAAPALLAAASAMSGGWPGMGLALLAVVLGMGGVLIERWLFFAEAKHTVMLYYGTPAA